MAAKSIEKLDKASVSNSPSLVEVVEQLEQIKMLLQQFLAAQSQLPATGKRKSATRRRGPITKPPTAEQLERAHKALGLWGFRVKQ